MIDHSVYPDQRHPDTFADEGDRADYLMRICAAFDFGVLPERATVELFRTWRDVFDGHPLPASPAYHALRATFGWPPVAPAPLLARTAWEIQDAREDRQDPLAGLT